MTRLDNLIADIRRVKAETRSDHIYLYPEQIRLLRDAGKLHDGKFEGAEVKEVKR